MGLDTALGAGGVYFGTDPALGIPKAVAGLAEEAAGAAGAGATGAGADAVGADAPGVNPPIGLDTTFGAGGVYLGTDPALGIPKAVAGLDPLAAGAEAATGAAGAGAEPPGVNPPMGLDTALGAGGVYLGTDPALGIPKAVAGFPDEAAGAGAAGAGAAGAGVEPPGV
jgi:hypothetical protein